jgi:DNA-binding response OmpR family regulator
MSKPAPNSACPCCGQPWDAAGPKADARRSLFPLLDQISPQRARILEYLLDHFGEWSPRKKIADAIYADDVHGGPDNCDNVVAVQLMRIRHRIAPLGFVIESKSNYGSRLRRSLYPEHAK